MVNISLRQRLVLLLTQYAVLHEKNHLCWVFYHNEATTLNSESKTIVIVKLQSALNCLPKTRCYQDTYCFQNFSICYFSIVDMHETYLMAYENRFSIVRFIESFDWTSKDRKKFNHITIQGGPKSVYRKKIEFSHQNLYQMGWFFYQW
jgi:hypothetical protein